MTIYTEEEKKQLHSVSILEIMAHFGKRLDHTRSGLYFSPFREETNPSFHLDEPKNSWYDYGTGEGGTLFEFVCKFVGCSRGEVYDWLASFRNMVPECEYRSLVAPILEKERNPSRIVIDSASHNFTRHKLVEYAASRAVSKDVLKRYCEEVFYHIDSDSDRQFYAIGFKKNSPLTAKVNIMLQAFAATGQLQELANKYGVGTSVITDFSSQLA